MQETNWLNACKICDVALCETVDKLKATGLSENKACQMMATKTEDLYTGDQLRNRYRYHTGKNEKSDEIHQDEAAEAAEDAAPKKKTPASKKEEPPLFDRDGKPNVPNKVQQFTNLQKRLEHLNADIKGLTDSGIDGNAIVGIGIQIKFLITWFKGLSYNKEQEKEKADGK